MFPYLSRNQVPMREPTPAIRGLAAALRRDVEILATDIGPRGWFAPRQYGLAEQFLYSVLSSAGYSVSRHAVTCCDNSLAHNLIAELPGTHHPDRIIVAGAHYDSVEGCPAANDNASGVAGILALARAFAAAPRQSTIRFVLFANEEPPHFNMNGMGSQEYAKECRNRGDGIRGMFCLETIGCYSSVEGSQQWPHPSIGHLLGTVGDFVCLVGTTSSRSWIAACSAAFARADAFSHCAAAVPDMIHQANWSDHRGFVEAGYQAFMVTDTAPLRYPHYHLVTDTPDKIDYLAMANVVHGVERMLGEVADDVGNK